MKKVLFLQVSLCFLMIMGTCMVASGSDVTIRYGGQYYPGEFVLQGTPEIWEKFGLNVQHMIFSSGTENNQALISGRCDINCGSDSKTVALFSVMEEKALIIGSIQKGDRYATVIRSDSEYTSWSDLKGKTVATRLGSGAEQVLRRYFSQYSSASWDEFKWVNLKVEDMIAALQGGQIEAFTVWEPTCAIAETQGAGRILRTYGDISPVPVLLHTTTEFASKHRPEIIQFLCAHLEKAQFIKEKPQKAAHKAAEAAKKKGYHVSEDAFSKVFERIDFSIDLNQEIIDAIENTAGFLHQKGKIDSIPSFRYDTSLLEEAKAVFEKGKK